MKQGLYESKMTLLVYLLEQASFTLRAFDNPARAKSIAKGIVADIMDNMDFSPINEREAIEQSYQEYMKACECKCHYKCCQQNNV